jgi:O-antigen ligase
MQRKRPFWIPSVNALTVICAVLLFTDAWIWTSEIATSESDIFRQIFKSTTYGLFLFQAVRYFLQVIVWGLKFNGATVLFFSISIIASILLLRSASLFYSFQAIVCFLGISFGMIPIYHDFGLRRILRVALATLLVALWGSALLAVFVPDLGTQHLPGFEGYWRGLFSHKNGLGHAALLAGLLLLVLWPSQGRYLRLANAALIILCLLLARSSTSLVCLITAVSIYLIFHASRRVLPDGYLARSFALGFILVLAVIVALFWQDILFAFGKDPTFSGRLSIWKVMLALWEQAPILGNGLGFLATDTGIVAQIRAATFSVLISAHSGYVQAMVETGLAGLAAFVIPFLVILWAAIFRRSRFTEIGADHALAISAAILQLSVTEAYNSFYSGVGTIIANLLLISVFGRPQMRVQNATLRRKIRYAGLRPAGVRVTLGGGDLTSGPIT